MAATPSLTLKSRDPSTVANLPAPQRVSVHHPYLASRSLKTQRYPLSRVVQGHTCLRMQKVHFNEVVFIPTCLCDSCRSYFPHCIIHTYCLHFSCHVISLVFDIHFSITLTNSSPQRARCLQHRGVCSVGNDDILSLP